MKKFYIIAAFITSALIVLGAVIPQKGENYDLMDDTIFSIVENLVEKGMLQKPDLSIEKVQIYKQSDPNQDNPAYSYKADIHIKNNRGNLRNATVLLEENSKEKPYLIRNTGRGFTLEKDEFFIIKDYPLVFDGRLNAGSTDIKLQINKDLDRDLTNNTHQINFQEFPAKLQDIQIQELRENKTLAISYKTDDHIKKNFEFTIHSNSGMQFPSNELEYFEIDSSKNIIDYYRVTGSNEYYIRNNWDEKSDTYFNTQFIDIGEKINKNQPFSIFIKATDPQTGDYAVSDILHFQSSEGMNKAELAKLIINLTNTEIYDEGEIYYTDITKDDWHFPYVQTLYNLGVTDLSSQNFVPEAKITRGELLRIVIEFFDVDLVSRAKDSRFDDINEDNEIYHYTQALHVSGGADNLGDNFMPDSLASRNFLNYLIKTYAQAD